MAGCPQLARGSEESSAGKQSHDLAWWGAVATVRRSCPDTGCPRRGDTGVTGSRSTGDILGQTVLGMGAALCMVGHPAACLP